MEYLVDAVCQLYPNPMGMFNTTLIYCMWCNVGWQSISEYVHTYLVLMIKSRQIICCLHIFSICNMGMSGLPDMYVHPKPEGYISSLQQNFSGQRLGKFPTNSQIYRYFNPQIFTMHDIENDEVCVFSMSRFSVQIHFSIHNDNLLSNSF